MPAGASSPPSIAIITKSRATYFKPLYEAFAEAQPAPWRTAMIWPEVLTNEHPDDTVTPFGDNIDIIPVHTSLQSRILKKNIDITASEQFLPSFDAIRKLHQLSPKALLIHEFPLFTIQALLYAKLRRIPVVLSTEVGRSNAHKFSAKTRLWHSFWGKFIDGVAAFSPTGTEPLGGLQLPTTTTYHAVDSRLYLPLDRKKPADEPLIFVYLGRLIHRKGLDLWLEAAARLKQQTSQPFKLRFIGGGDNTWLKQQIEHFGMWDHVELTDFLSGEALRVALGSADVFVLPTRDDNYAAVVHEAACMAMPLLISKYAGASGPLVDEGYNGYVFDPYDIQEFTSLMAKFFDPEHRAYLGKNSRLVGERWCARQQGKELWDWFAKNILCI